MTYGIKKPGKRPRILTTNGEFLSSRFVGIGAARHKEWKTRQCAEKHAKRLGGEVFPITDILHY